MLSRVADSLFWVGRCVERAENIARFIDANLTMSLNHSETSGQQWAPLLYSTGDEKIYTERYGTPTQDNAIRFLCFDQEYRNSIISCLSQARENARTVRENISSAMWEEINKAYHLARAATNSPRTLADPYEFLTKIKLASNLLDGMTHATMSQGEGWHFLRMGRLLERADKTSRILDVKYYILLPRVQDVGSPLDIVQWSALLQSASALEMYRRLHGRITPSKVADFLLFDREFPRSIQFCLSRAEESAHCITGTPLGTFSNRVEQLLGRMRSELDYTDVNDVISIGLHEFLDEFQLKLNRIGQAIQDTFFAIEEPAPVVERPLFSQSQTQTQHA